MNYGEIFSKFWKYMCKSISESDKLENNLSKYCADSGSHEEGLTKSISESDKLDVLLYNDTKGSKINKGLTIIISV